MKIMKHLEDLKLDDFYFFIKRFTNKNLIEVSEKLDGSYHLSFGYDEFGKMWFGLKGSRIYKNPNDLPQTWQWNGYRCAMRAISDKRRYFALKFGAGPGVVVHCEVLYGKRPNTIEYTNGNHVVFLYNTGGDAKLYRHFTDLEDSHFDTVLYDIHGVPYPKREHWRFSVKGFVKRPEDFDYTGLEEMYQDLKKTAGTLDTWPRWSDSVKKKVCQKKKAIRLFLVDRIVRNLKPSIGGEKVEGIVLTKLSHKQRGGRVEGNVFIPERMDELHLRADAMTKIVDPEFTELNKKYWKYAKLCRNGAKIDGAWKEGLHMRFKSWLAELTGVKMIHSIGYKAKIDKYGGIDNYMKEKGLNPDEEYTRRFKILCTKALKALEFLEWTYLEDRHIYPQEIKDRTDFEILELKKNLSLLRLREEQITRKRVLEVVYDYF